MRWSIGACYFFDTENGPEVRQQIEIDKETYSVSQDTACLSHCLLLLIDALKKPSNGVIK